MASAKHMSSASGRPQWGCGYFASATLWAANSSLRRLDHTHTRTQLLVLTKLEVIRMAVAPFVCVYVTPRQEPPASVSASVLASASGPTRGATSRPAAHKHPPASGAPAGGPSGHLIDTCAPPARWNGIFCSLAQGWPKKHFVAARLRFGAPICFARPKSLANFW